MHGPFDPAGGRCLEPEAPNFARCPKFAADFAGLLLLPYLLTPLYRTGHPVSTLMVWRKLTGAPVSRQWVDLDAMSPVLPRTVIASEDANSAAITASTGTPCAT